MKVYFILVTAALVSIAATQYPCHFCESTDAQICEQSESVENCNTEGCVTVTVSLIGIPDNNGTCPECPTGINYASSPYYYKGCLDNGNFIHKVAQRAGVGHTNIQYCFEEFCNAHNSGTFRAKNLASNLNVTQILQEIEKGVPVTITGPDGKPILVITAG